jgi:phosphoglycolate phosphatase-like HAD superfamily hydrolase
MKIKAVIFDLDGTIASFNLDYKSVRVEVRSLLIKTGVPASVLAINESIFEMLKKTEIFLRGSGKADRFIQKVRQKALEIAERYELEAANSTSLLPGVPETLKALRRMRLRIGLCTINSDKSTRHILKRFGIDGFFDEVTPRNKVRYVKPSSEHLAFTLKALQVKAKEAMIVGDGTVDMRCAHELGTIAVGLPIGVASREELISSGANYLITSITDLPVLVRQIKQINEKMKPRDTLKVF